MSPQRLRRHSFLYGKYLRNKMDAKLRFSLNALYNRNNTIGVYPGMRSNKIYALLNRDSFIHFFSISQSPMILALWNGCFLK